jgi:hypothetical protein
VCNVFEINQFGKREPQRKYKKESSEDAELISASYSMQFSQEKKAYVAYKLGWIERSLNWLEYFAAG